MNNILNKSYIAIDSDNKSSVFLKSWFFFFHLVLNSGKLSREWIYCFFLNLIFGKQKTYSVTKFKVVMLKEYPGFVYAWASVCIWFSFAEQKSIYKRKMNIVSWSLEVIHLLPLTVLKLPIAESVPDIRFWEMYSNLLRLLWHIFSVLHNLQFINQIFIDYPLHTNH